MKKKKSSHASSPRRKAAILHAALACFTEMGVAGTGVGDVCERAGVSVGSLYHHFGSREGLAIELYIEGIRSYQEGLAAELGRHRSAREGVHAMVRHHLGWVKKQGDWARFLFHQRHADFMGGVDDEIGKMNRDFAGNIAGWITGHVESGELRPLPWDIFLCVLLGPCQEYSRLYLSGRRTTTIAKAVREIGNSVWDAVRARP